MTDRVKGFTVTLDQDYRIDDVETILNAIRMIKGVVHVEPSIVDIDDQMNQARVKYELRDKFYNFMKENL
ncbi:hypothetical protein M0Q97_07400 [Candidatus Dojkabacteria bacterium]|jgi:hypothetical protein|nr:hypothetical protein [Candidatus Dojkabacteria bacterium]